MSKLTHRGFFCVVFALSSWAPTLTAQNVLPAPVFDAAVLLPAIFGEIRAAPDFDGDGDFDLVTVNPATLPATLNGLANDGAGNFALAWTISAPLALPAAPVASALGTSVALPTSPREDFIVAIGSSLVAFTSNPMLSPPTVAWVAVTPSAILRSAYADYDADGDTDAALLQADSSVTLIINNGLAPATVVPAAAPASGITDVAAIEVSGDTRPDVVCTTAGQNLLAFSVSTATMALTPVFNLTLPASGARGVCGGDFDADGDTDLMVLVQQFPASVGRCQVRRLGPSAFVVEPVVATLPGQLMNAGTALQSADIDGDLDPDLVVAFGGLMVERNVAGAWVGSTMRRPLPATGGPFLLRDFNGDGRLDATSRSAMVFGTENRGLEVEPGPTIWSQVGVHPGDFDNDGDLDLNPGLPHVFSYLGPSASAAVHNDGNAGFFPSAADVSGAPVGTIYNQDTTAIDVDNDGDQDLLADRVMGPNRVTVLLENLGGGRYVDRGLASSTNLTLGMGWPITLDGRRFDVLGDLDGDGDQDLAVVDYSPMGTISLCTMWQNNGTSGFTPMASFIMAVVSAIGDLTGDGIADLLLTATAMDGWAPYSMIVVPGLGNGQFASNATWQTLVTGLGGTFGPPVSLDTAPSFPWVFRADFDQDGDRDLLVSSAGTHYVFTMTPTGLLTPPSTILSVLPIPKGVAVADVSGDGIPEILAWDENGTELSSVLGAAGVGFPIFQDLQPSLIADFDADGDADALESRDLRVYSFLAPPPSPITAVSRGLQLTPPIGARRQQFGVGTAGSLGYVPLLGCTGPLIGTTPVSLRVSRGLGASFGYLGIGSSALPSPAGGGNLYLSPLLLLPVTLGGPANQAAAGFLDLPTVASSSISGSELTLQGAFTDPSSPAGFTLTQALAIRAGF